jgi:hypothetical protein
MANKLIYFFGKSKTDGSGDMKSLLGGKGANLAQMTKIGLPVPSGFTITTEVCVNYYKNGRKYPAELSSELEKAVKWLEKETGKKFGDVKNPLLVSVRSGARDSMPGMMDTILNLGLNDAATEGLAAATKNPRFAWDSYRRFIQMYGDVVMGLKPVSKEEHDPFEVVIDMLKEKKGVQLDTELDTEDLKELVLRFKGLIRARVGREFPDFLDGKAERRLRLVPDQITGRGVELARGASVAKDLPLALYAGRVVLDAHFERAFAEDRAFVWQVDGERDRRDLAGSHTPGHCRIARAKAAKSSWAERVMSMPLLVAQCRVHHA